MAQRRSSDAVGVKNRKRFEEMSRDELLALIVVTEKRLKYLRFLASDKEGGL